MNSNKLIAYIGTYTSGESQGIYLFEVDPHTGNLNLIDTSEKIENPTYLAIDQEIEHLYTVMEIEKFNGEKGGAVAAFTIDKNTGFLEIMNSQPTTGRTPCHISINKSKTHLFAANYSEGTISVFPINNDGNLSPASCVIEHRGTGPNKQRQEKAHAHYASLTPDEKFLCAVDLGIDKIMVYSFDDKTGKLSPAAQQPEVIIKPGSGPRHMAFHQSGRFAYLINELSSDIVAFEYTKENGLFNELQYISTLPPEFSDVNYCSAIHISPDGEFLYASNRGHDSIAIFKIDTVSGKLDLISTTSTGGSFPRDFGIDPSGKFMYVANQYSSNLVVFKIFKDTGLIEPTGYTISVPDPVCVKFAVL